MARLFIFGNGYDMSRLNKKTSYLKFRDYLEEKYNISLLDYVDVQNCSIWPKCIWDAFYTPEEDEKRIIEKRKKAAAFYLFKFIEKLDENGSETNWCRFEGALGKLPLSEVINQNIKSNKKEGIILEKSLGSPYEREHDLIVSLSGEIKMLFAEWIRTIEIDCSKSVFEKEEIKEIKSNDIFISFNYTNTIEKMFTSISAEFVNHLHGKAIKEEELIVGHRKKDEDILIENDPEGFKKDMIISLRKDVDSIIIKNESLWERIREEFKKDCDNEIYEFGWSCSEEDEEYVKKIIEIIPNKENTILYLNDFKKEASKKQITWEKYGYDGHITFYNEKDTNIKKEFIK